MLGVMVDMKLLSTSTSYPMLLHSLFGVITGGYASFLSAAASPITTSTKKLLLRLTTYSRNVEKYAIFPFTDAGSVYPVSRHTNTMIILVLSGRSLLAIDQETLLECFG